MNRPIPSLNVRCRSPKERLYCFLTKMPYTKIATAASFKVISYRRKNRIITFLHRIKRKSTLGMFSETCDKYSWPTYCLFSIPLTYIILDNIDSDSNILEKSILSKII